MTINAYTDKGFKLIDFNSDDWHQDEWDNWTLLDALLEASLGDVALPVVGGTPNAITLDYTPDHTLVNGTTLVFILAASPTGPTTVTVDANPAKSLLILGTAVASGDLQAGDTVKAVYDGTNIHVISPLRKFSRISLIDGVSGATSDTDADNLVISSNLTAGISILTPNTVAGRIYFADPGSGKAGSIVYDHTSNSFTFGVNAVDTMVLDANGIRLIQGRIDMNMTGANDFRIVENAADQIRLGSSAVSNGVQINIATGLITFLTDATAAGNLSVTGNLTVTGAISGTINGNDTAYGVSWDSNLGVASKNAIYDKIEALDAAKANLASPTFTGDPKAPTPSTGDNDTSIATTAFVKAQGYATLASPTFTGTVNYTATVGAGTTTIEVGFRGVPHQAKTGNYDLVLGDRDTCINITTGGVDIPDNSSVAFPTGSTVLVYNNSGSSQSIAMIGTDTLRLAGTATTGTRTLAQRGIATLHKVGTTEWICYGAGVT